MTTIHIDNEAVLGPLELWRHSIGHGGINPLPLPNRVVGGLRQLKPRLIRIFIQEFFTLYPDHGRFDWRTLDAYMDALSWTGAKVVAAITIKPPVLYPDINQDTWRPNNIPEWQHLIRTLVHRYSVQRNLVTHWEIGNEVDIGEDGGCPYRIKNPADYVSYYEMTARAILDAFPNAKVGGPAMANLYGDPLPGFLQACLEQNVPLDFVSWHLYHSDPERYGQLVHDARQMVERLPGKPELMVTEWSPFPSAWKQGNDTDATAERAFDLDRAAVTTSAILEMAKAGVDASFYYHLWDQVCDPTDFASFMSTPGVHNMVHHWNEFPHHLGLFGVNTEVRPQYFVFWMLAHMGSEHLNAVTEDKQLAISASRDVRGTHLLAVNHQAEKQDKRVTLKYTHLHPGPKMLAVYRLESTQRWNAEKLELQPVEQRQTYALESYQCQVWVPADSVALVCLHGV